jgi:hypothetical protein
MIVPLSRGLEVGAADTEETYDSWESREHNYRYPDTYVSAHRVKN